MLLITLLSLSITSLFCEFESKLIWGGDISNRSSSVWGRKPSSTKRDSYPDWSQNDSISKRSTVSTDGIGKSCAKLFSKKGYKTILIGRRKDRLVKLAKKLG